MTDYSELKQLAEALNRAIAQAEHKPGEWAETAQSMGGICCPGEPFQIGKPWAKEEPWASFSHKRDSWLAVAAVNALPELLELIAENEALRQSVTGKVVCPLELFQDLRDSAADEAAQYRAGGMAEYRPHRMYALDKTVTDCDELIAAMSKGEQV
jgi:hypothetical protein